MDKEVTGTSEELSVEEKYIDVMLSITVGDSEKRTVFVNPAVAMITKIPNIRHEPKEGDFYGIRFENSNDIESKCKNPKYHNVVNGACLDFNVATKDAAAVSSMQDKLWRISRRLAEKEMQAMLEDEGLNCVEAKDILNYARVSFYLKIDLHVVLDEETKVLKSIYAYFTDHKGRRVSSVKTLFPFNHKLFGRMKIGPDAGHRHTDETVVRDIHCHYCYKKLATGTIEELAEEGNLKDVCDVCQEVEDADKIVYNGKDPEVTRSYKISGKASIVDNLEVLFREISILSNVGASREIKLYVDGDGAVDLKIEREDGEKLKNNCRKHGYLKRENLYGEGHETGRLTYLDLG